MRASYEKGYIEKTILSISLVFPIFAAVAKTKLPFR
jgi:hypothetical protein